jgi:murein L,D-transpeptidase YcbB/YkuD
MFAAVIFHLSMSKKYLSYSPLVVFLLFLFLFSCNGSKRPPGSDIASSPQQLNEKAIDNIHQVLDFAEGNKGDMGDSVFLSNTPQLQFIYEKKEFGSIWSSNEKWNALGDSLLGFIAAAKLYGLFPDDYHFSQLDLIQKFFLRDSLAKSLRRDAVLWSKADLMLTDAFVQIIKDIKLGRLPKDSITLRADSVLADDFYLEQLGGLEQSGSLTPVIQALEPKYQGYQDLKAGIKKFLDSADNRLFTIVPFRSKDTAAYKRALQRRLYEGGFINYDSIPADSVKLAEAVKKFQKRKGITADGKAGETTIRMMNLTDREKFIRIAITMDRYKMLPEKMPSRYIWVNLPGYYMKLVDADSVRIFSKIICGKPLTRTPVLTSSISEMITYPQWTIPTSIIVKEVLPGVKKDTAYFTKKGFSLIDKEGNEVDPHSVQWLKYNKGIPYKVVQGSGDDNALGVLKFNFNNKYAVYMHDTNQRYLFSQAMRSLSHGCVRVQDWDKLAYDIIRYDNNDTLAVKKSSPKEDSLNAWLKRKEKHSISIHNRLPVYIRYFTCEGRDSSIVFYDDMYGEDKLLREKYFAGK